MDARPVNPLPGDEDTELDRLRRENALLQAQLKQQQAAAENYRYIVELHPEVPWTAAPDGAILDFNQRWLDLTGLTREQALGEGWYQVPHPDDLPHMASAWTHSVQTGKPYEVEHRIRLADGTYRWMRSRAYARRDEITGAIVRWYGTTEDIHERRQAEEQFLQQWRVFDTALSHTPDFTYTFDLEGRFTYVNRALLSHWRKTRAEAIGKNFFELGHPPALAARLQAQIQHVIQTRERIRDHTLLHDPDGQTRDYEYIFVPVLGAGGTVEAVAGSTRDITESKHAEAELARSRELLQLMIDNVPGLVSYIDPEYRYLFANRQYYEWFHKDSLVNEKIAAVAGEQVFQRILPYLRRALAGETIRFQELLPYADSAPRYVQVSYAPDHHADGTVRGVVTMVQDITVQKQLEEALRHSKERLQHVFTQAPVAVAVLRGRDLVYELANPAYQQFLPGRELLGQKLSEVAPEVSAATLAALYQVLDTGEPFVGHEYLIPLDRGGWTEDCWFTFVFQPLRELDGSISGIVVVAADVTTHVRARRELEHANRELEEFAFVASHDLQEPLRMVGIYSQLLLRRYLKNEPEAVEFGNFIRQGVIRMEALINDLLTYSRIIKTDELPDAFADLNEAFEQARAVLQNRIEETAATLTISVLPTVRGDTGQLAHVFQNLLSNALKYSHPGTPPIISVTAQQDAERWIISVQDNGIGFDPQYAERIFGLFKRLHKDAYPGTGLGLAICQRIIERTGGRIWADSRLGQGATFYFALPLLADTRARGAT